MDKRYLLFPVGLLISLTVLKSTRKLSPHNVANPSAVSTYPLSPLSETQSLSPSMGAFSNQRPLNPGEYEILKTNLQGVVAVRIGAQKIQSTYSNLRWSRCSGDSKKCVGFPSGEQLIWTKELGKYIPASLATGRFEIHGRLHPKGRLP